MHDLRSRVASEQEGHAAIQRAVAADREDISKQGAALLDMGQKVLYSSSRKPPSEAKQGCIVPVLPHQHLCPVLCH